MNDMISVALASYNGSRHIAAQLDSIAAQTRRPDEIVVADDGSSDDTCDIVRAFADRSGLPVRLIAHPSNIGIFENFVSAFHACRGAFIYYCDQDDVWRPEKIATVQRHFEVGVTLVMHSSAIVDERLQPLGRREPGNPAYGRLRLPVNTLTTYGYGHQMAFRRDVLPMMAHLRTAAVAAGRTEFGHCFDSLLPFSASIIGDITVLDDALTLFRRHAQATSGAGLAVSERGGVTRRARHILEVRELESATYVAVLERAIADNDLDRQAARVLQALRGQHLRVAIAGRLAREARWRRVALAPVALASALRKTGFSNDRPMHDLALAGISALS